MFEEFNLTNLTIENKDTLPDMVRIGSFERKPELVPAFLPFASQNGFCFEINPSTRDKVHNQLQYIALGILMQVNPALIKLSFIDIGFCTSFPLIHRLQLPNVKFISNRIEIKEELKKLTDTVRYLSTNCLGYDFSNITNYNEKAEFKEPYNLVFISNFPKEFKDEDIDLVYSLINEASKFGIYILMSYDRSMFPEINSFNQERFLKLFSIPKKMIHLDCTQSPVALNNFNVKIIKSQFEKYPFNFESYSNDEIAQVFDKINGSNCKAFDTSLDFISIPIGRSGGQEIFFEMGEKSDTYHALIAGRTRTGKSTLLNCIITRIAQLYSPDELRLFLLDYKQGVEFQIYENHPNVEVLLLDNSQLEFGIQQLKRFREEINKRAKLFRHLGAEINNIGEYNKKSKIRLPRLLLIIDEVQQLFVAFENRKLVNLLVKEIAKQGAGFGIHMLFCSQSYVDCKIDDDTLSQMNLRIAFNLANSRECRAILGGDNDVPVRLEKFHAVYNSKNGEKDYNQIVKLTNFEKTTILPILKEAGERFSDHESFEKTIIRPNSEDAPIVEAEEKKPRTEIRTVKRECKIKTDLDL